MKAVSSHTPPVGAVFGQEGTEIGKLTTVAGSFILTISSKLEPILPWPLNRPRERRRMLVLAGRLIGKKEGRLAGVENKAILTRGQCELCVPVGIGFMGGQWEGRVGSEHSDWAPCERLAAPAVHEE